MKFYKNVNICFLSSAVVFFLGATFLPGKVMESFCGFEKSYGDTRTLLGRMREFPDDLS